jgi:hypothetical protein
MRSWFPFADYDFWGYLVSGAVLAFAIAAALGISITAESFADPINVVAFAAASYTLGHANAALASWLLENIVVRRLFGSPLTVMTGEKKRTLLAAVIAPSYRALPMYVVDALKRRLRSERLPPSEELFQRAYHYGREFQDVRERLDAFRNQYGFCRNATLATLIAGWCALPWAAGKELQWILIVAVTAILLFARYLKFYRLFALELISTFAFREETDAH